MARKERNSVDYFPHSVNHGKKMFYLRDKFGNDGYAVWFMLLEQLGKADFHYLNLSDEIELMYLSSEFKVSELKLNEIIEALVKFKEFDYDLWNNEKILFNAKFNENIADAYKKRNNECVNSETIIDVLKSKGVTLSPKSTRKQLKSTRKQLKRDSLAPINTQSIVEYSKENKTIVKEEDETETKNKRKEEFNLFWDLYDNKKGRKKCFDKFKRLNQSEVDLILIKVKPYVISTPDVTYRKNPLTWLNGEHWNDEITSKKQSYKPQRPTF